MVKIITPNALLVNFLTWLHLGWSAPQRRHGENLIDAILVCDVEKTLCGLNRIVLNGRHETTVADFLSQSPWDGQGMDERRRWWTIWWTLECLCRSHQPNEPLRVLLIIDDTLVPKGKNSRKFEPLGKYRDYTRPGVAYCYGCCFVNCHIVVEGYGFTLGGRLYLKEKTVRKWNRGKKEPEERWRFRSKYQLARELLAELAVLLPGSVQVEVVFDSWYASNKLIRYCRQQGWQVTCQVKSNRHFNGKALTAQNLKHQRSVKVVIERTRSRQEYLTYQLQGHLKGWRDQVQIIVSKRHRRDKKPRYYLCTDLGRSAQEVLEIYDERWAVEVDHWYLKTQLGLGDFRVQSREAIEKWVALVYTSFLFLQVRLAAKQAWNRAIRQGREEEVDASVKILAEGGNCDTLAEVLREHRRTHEEATLRAMCEQAIQTGDVEAVLARFLPQAAV